MQQNKHFKDSENIGKMSISRQAVGWKPKEVKKKTKENVSN